MAIPDWVSPSEYTAGGADVPRHDANDLSLRVVRVTAVIQVVLLSALVLLSSYWRFPASESLSFPVADGWCDGDLEGIATHCFGDFGYQLANARLADPWSTGLNPYPPSVYVLFDGFRILEGALGYNFSLAIYMLTLVVSVGATCWLVCRRTALGRQDPVAVSIAVLLGWGLISALDRGNNVVWLMPLAVMLLAPGARRDRLQWWAVVMLALVKPQFLVVGASFGLFALVRMALMFGAAQVLATAVLLGPSRLVEGLRSWVSSVISNDDYPIGLGQNSSLDSAAETISQALPAWRFIELGSDVVARIPIGFVFAASYLALALTSSRRRASGSGPSFEMIALGMIVAVMTPAIVFPYYAVVVQILALMWLDSKGRVKVGADEVLSRPPPQVPLITVLFVLSSVTVVDPSSNRHLSVVLLPLAVLVFIPYMMLRPSMWTGRSLPDASE